MHHLSFQKSLLNSYISAFSCNLLTLSEENKKFKLKILFIKLFATSVRSIFFLFVIGIETRERQGWALSCYFLKTAFKKKLQLQTLITRRPFLYLETSSWFYLIFHSVPHGATSKSTHAIWAYAIPQIKTFSLFLIKAWCNSDGKKLKVSGKQHMDILLIIFFNR